MNDKILKKSIEINNLLLKNKIIEEFLNLKKVINEDQELNKLWKKMNYYKNCNNESEDNFEAQLIYKEIISHPLISNYLECKKEVKELLNEVKKEIL